MIHADVHVAGRDQRVDRQFQQAQLGLRRRQVGGLDLALRLEQRGQVGVAVHRDAVRPCGDHRLQRARETLDGLPGQPVDQVHVDRLEAVGAAGLDDGEGFLHALDAIDGTLHLRIEVLDAEAGAVEADVGELGDVCRLDEAGIEFDRDVAAIAVGEAEVAAQAVHDFTQLRRGQEIGRAAAEVQLDDLAVAVEQLAVQRDLAVQAGQVALGAAGVAGDHAVAATVEAGALAERHVHVERQPARDRVAIAGADRFAKLRLAEAAGELRRRRVRGVAGPRPVVAAQEVGIDRAMGAHVAGR